MQKSILEANLSADLRVYVVWLPMLRRDTRDSADYSRLWLSDARVTHLWNEDRSIGVWFKENITPDYSGPVQWDAYFIYDREAKWEDAPKALVGWGRTVIEQAEALMTHFEDLIRK